MPRKNDEGIVIIVTTPIPVPICLGAIPMPPLPVSVAALMGITSGSLRIPAYDPRAKPARPCPTPPSGSLQSTAGRATLPESRRAHPSPFSSKKRPARLRCTPPPHGCSDLNDTSGSGLSSIQRLAPVTRTGTESDTAASNERMRTKRIATAAHIAAKSAGMGNSGAWMS